MSNKVSIGEMELFSIGEIKRDVRSKQYRFVFHLEWYQDGVDEKDAAEKAFDFVFHEGHRGLLRQQVAIQRLGRADTDDE